MFHFWLLRFFLAAAWGLAVGGPRVQNTVPPPADSFPIRPNLSCAAALDPPPLPFHVPLSPEEEERAVAVYKSSIVITTHDHCYHPDDYRDMERSGITVRTIKVTVDGHYRWGGTRFPIESEVVGWEERGKSGIALLNQDATLSGGKLLIIRGVEDIYRAKSEGKLGIIISFEGGRPLAGKLKNLETFYHLGLRELQLFWAVPSPLKKADGGLSPFGEDVIREMHRLGVVLDLSHMPEHAYTRALEITGHPVVISHCSVAFEERSARPNTDHLDDVTIRKIADNGGVIALHFYEGYIHSRRGKKYPSVEDLVDHMDHIRQVAGVDFIGLGPDFSPMKGWRWVEGAETMEGMPNVVREMVRRGYRDDEIRKVLGLNLMRVYKKVWKN